MTPIFLNTPELLYTWWDRASVHLDPVVKHAARGEFELDDLRRMCANEKAMCVVVTDGEEVIMAMVFEFLFYPKMTACNIMALGGSCLDEIAGAFFVTFKRWCYNMGVTVIEASCSSAMARLLKRQGFEKTYEVVRHAIDPRLSGTD